MTDWKTHSKENKNRWELNASFWDEYMGDKDNRYFNELIKPNTEKLLNIKPNEKILDIACGHGNFSRRLAELGANVTAFDFSETLISNAKKRSKNHSIDFNVIDATDFNALIKLGENKFNSAVSNMALMDISEIIPLCKAIYKLLVVNGKFVFSITHPCFQAPGYKKIYEEDECGKETYSIKINRYIDTEVTEGVAIRNQPSLQYYFHRPLSKLLNCFFNTGFVLDGLIEPVFKKEKIRRFDWFDIPPTIIFRLLKK